VIPERDRLKIREVFLDSKAFFEVKKICYLPDMSSKAKMITGIRVFDDVVSRRDSREARVDDGAKRRHMEFAL